MTDNDVFNANKADADKADADETRHAASPTADAESSSADADHPRGNESGFDARRFLQGLDAIFDAHEAAEQAEPYLLRATAAAERAHDDEGLLTVLNETMGFYRSQGRHDANARIIQRTLALASRLRLVERDPQAWATTLINAATGMRAARRYDEAESLYHRALVAADAAFSPTDRRLAALHNNLSMLYGETGRTEHARNELERALRLLEASSPNADADLDVASTHTNLALLLLQLRQSRSDARGEDGNGDGNKDDATHGKNGDDAARMLDSAMHHAAKALDIYRNGHLEHSAHYASALAGYAQVCYMAGRFALAVDGYRRALGVIEECYGCDTDYYRTTSANLRMAEQSLGDEERPMDVVDGEVGKCPTNSGAAKTSHAVSASTASADFVATDDSTNHDASASTASAIPDISTHPIPRQNPQRPSISGMVLARAFWNDCGKPMIATKYPEYQGRIAAGLVGHGSECLGFDDVYSQDHDFGPRFCLWLTDEDYAAIGARLQADYEALDRAFTVDGQGDPRFRGHGKAISAADRTDAGNAGIDGNGTTSASMPPEAFADTDRTPATPRAQGENRRDGVFRINDFFERLTNYPEAPAQTDYAAWLTLPEATLATATNGRVFADPLGMFSKTRQGFTFMPEDVRVSLISRRLGMMAQAGQYNLPRMLERGDGAAAMLSITQFVDATASLVFLINEPVSVGYLPYYKWRFAALRKLSRRMATRLADVAEQLETILRLSSAACFGGEGFGEGGKGAGPAIDTITTTIEHICAEVVTELLHEGLTESHETFLEWQRPYVEKHIVATDACLRSL